MLNVSRISLAQGFILFRLKLQRKFGGTLKAECLYKVLWLGFVAGIPCTSLQQALQYTVQ